MFRDLKILLVLLGLATVAGAILFMGPEEVRNPQETPALNPGASGMTDAGSSTAEARSPADAVLASRFHDGVAGPSDGEVIESRGLVVRATWEDDGTPAAELGLLVIPQAGAEHGRSRSGVTDAGGCFRAPDLEAGAWTVQLFSGDLGVAHVVHDQVTGMDFKVARGVTVEGEVEDDAGSAVGGASIWHSPDSEVARGYNAGTADAHGRFLLRGLRPGSLLGAQAHGHIPSALERIAGTPGGAVRVRLVLDSNAGSVRGRVISDCGEPVGGARLRIGALERSAGNYLDDGRFVSSGPPRVVSTQADGSFACPDLPSGMLDAVVRAAGHAPVRTQLESARHGGTAAEIVLPPEAVLGGVVRDLRGGAVAGAIVEIRLGAPFGSASVKTAEDGSFRASGLPGGVFEATVTATGGAVTAPVRLRAGEATTWDVVIPDRPSIRGRVLDENGDPLAGWRVAASPLAFSGATPSGTETDGGGAFELRPELLSPHDVVAEAPGTTGAHRWSVQAVARPGAGELIMIAGADSRPSAFVFGRILMPGGEPAQGTATAFDGGGDGRGEGVAITPGDGAFRIGPLKPGRWRVMVRVDGLPPQAAGEFEIRASETADLGVVRLQPEAVLRARVRRADGGSCADLRVSVPTARGSAPLTHVPEGVLTGVLPPGDHLLQIRAAGLPVSFHPVQLLPGRDTTVEIVLPVARLHKISCPLPSGTATPQELQLKIRDSAGRTVEDLVWSWAPECGPVPEVGIALSPGRHDAAVRTDSGLSGAGTIVISDAGDASPLIVLALR